MKVRNDSKALKDYLAREYEHEIARVKQHAKQEVARILSDYEQQGDEQAAAHLREAKRSAKQEQTQAVAAAKQQARLAEQDARAQLLREVTRLVLEREHAKPKKQREQLLARMRSGIEEALAQRGHDPEDFAFQEDLERLRVSASTEDLLVEDSAQQRVHDKKQAIVKHIMEEAQ